MAIKKFYSNKNKPSWKFDKRKEKFWSWGFDIYLSNGKRKREGGFASKSLAESAVARIKLGEVNKKYELVDDSIFPSCAELFQKRIDNVTERGEKTRSIRVLQMLLDLLHEKGLDDLKINELTTGNIDLFTQKRQKEDVKDETINRDLRVIRATLNQAQTFFDDLENYNPPKVRFLKVAKTRRERIVDSTELKAILNYLLKPQTAEESKEIFLSRKRAGLLFLLSAVTGARPGELVALRQSDILKDIKSLRITGKKTRFKTSKTVRYFPLIQIIENILDEAIEIKAGKFIFTNKGTITETYYKQIKDACKACGIVYGRKVKGGLIPYDLRHTATTLIMHSGADFETVASITGQSRHTLWHYTHANENSINAAVSVLEDFANNSLGGHGLDTKEKRKLVKSASSTK